MINGIDYEPDIESNSGNELKFNPSLLGYASINQYHHDNVFASGDATRSRDRGSADGRHVRCRTVS
jgi:hypothetical protein